MSPAWINEISTATGTKNQGNDSTTSNPVGDLNWIEKCWAWLKSRIRKLLPQSDSLRDAMASVLKQAAS